MFLKYKFKKHPSSQNVLFQKVPLCFIGLTLLIPYILSTRSQFAGCQLRVFSLASKEDADLDMDQRK